MKITRWWPSHCACSVSYSWNPDDPEGQRAHRFYAVHERCDKHRGIAEGQALLELLVAENQAYSRARAEEDAANG